MKRDLVFGMRPSVRVTTKKKSAPKKRVLDARPDTTDFRDRLYEPTLVEVPVHVRLEDYLKRGVPVLDQRAEGACTGFGLATVANYLLRRRAVVPDATAVSPRMLYEMARKYDEWPGERYEGSSARGAMKGWYRHGVCARTKWPDRSRTSPTNTRVTDASRRPLGAYYRVNHRDLVAMHAAIAEVGILYASAIVHEGWSDLAGDGLIPPVGDELGGHAFAIVAYDEAGFWVQNSWGVDWGRKGFGRVTYDDWLEHGTDVWVARLGVPIELHTAAAAATARSAAAGGRETYSFQDVRPHIVSFGNDGKLRKEGTYGTDERDVAEILTNDFRRVTRDWRGKKRLLLYAHGGLVGETAAIDRVAEYRGMMLQHQIYPLAFVWRTDWWTTLKNILDDALRGRRSEGWLDAGKDFLLDRVDDTLEPLARLLGGKPQWDEMKENGLRATTSKDGGGRIVASQVRALLARDASVELHVASHSAGSIIHAPFIQLLTSRGVIASGPMKGVRGLGLRMATSALWAPACTVDLFKQTYLPSIESGAIGRFSLFTLTDDAEKDDNCAGLYHKSLLYLVSNAFEAQARIPTRRDGEPILGMEKFVERDRALINRLGGIDGDWWVRAPNKVKDGDSGGSRSKRHGDFDDDDATLKATVARILNAPAAAGTFEFHRSASGLRAARRQISEVR